MPTIRPRLTLSGRGLGASVAIGPLRITRSGRGRFSFGLALPRARAGRAVDLVRARDPRPGAPLADQAHQHFTDQMRQRLTPEPPTVLSNGRTPTAGDLVDRVQWGPPQGPRLPPSTRPAVAAERCATATLAGAAVCGHGPGFHDGWPAGTAPYTRCWADGCRCSGWTDPGPEWPAWAVDPDQVAGPREGA